MAAPFHPSAEGGFDRRLVIDRGRQELLIVGRPDDQLVRRKSRNAVWQVPPGSTLVTTMVSSLSPS